jgi:hypothetical protein
MTRDPPVDMEFSVAKFAELKIKKRRSSEGNNVTYIKSIDAYYKGCKER